MTDAEMYLKLAETQRRLSDECMKKALHYEARAKQFEARAAECADDAQIKPERGGTVKGI